MGTIKLTDENFDESIKEGIILVDFWAEWCGPCKMIEPVLEEISNELNNVKIGKLDVDNNSVTSSIYGIRSLPTMLIFKNGVVVNQITGAIPKQQIINSINKFL